MQKVTDCLTSNYKCLVLNKVYEIIRMNKKIISKNDLVFLNRLLFGGPEPEVCNGGRGELMRHGVVGQALKQPAIQFMTNMQAN